MLQKEAYFIKCLYSDKILRGPFDKTEIQSSLEAVADRIRIERGNFSQPPYKLEMRMINVNETEESAE